MQHLGNGKFQCNIRKTAFKYPKVYKYYSIGTEFYTFHERMSPKVNDGPAMRPDKTGNKHKGIVSCWKVEGPFEDKKVQGSITRIIAWNS